MKDNALIQFDNEKRENIAKMGNDESLRTLSNQWLIKAADYKFGYNFTWMGCPVIQLPTDMIAIQELIWSIKPDVIIETGIAFGGNLIFSASMLTLLGNGGKVIGVDIEIRAHNRAFIESHPMSDKIVLIEGSSTAEATVNAVKAHLEGNKKVLIFLDSNHTHEHVLKELEIYSEFVSTDSYIVVFDTSVDLFPNEYFEDRPWSVGNSPMSAVKEFLKSTDKFSVDKEMETKLLVTSCPNGFLKKIK